MQTLHVNGYDMAYLDIGHGPPLVCVHGSLCDFRIWSPVLGPLFTIGAEPIAWGIIAYGFIASVLPVWMLLCPRDYLSTFMKIGTIVLLALGLLIVRPPLQMPALTQFIDGSGPVFAGKLFPFAFITIACGAISGFHALVSSGTTPKMLRREGDARVIGYGGMLMESFRMSHRRG